MSLIEPPTSAERKEAQIVKTPNAVPMMWNPMFHPIQHGPKSR